MFSGITQGLVPVRIVRRETGRLSYQLELTEALAANLEIGASVAVNGVCQTVVALEGTTASFDAIAETLRCTNLGELQVGALVSVERSRRIGDEIGGHEVSGHVSGVGVVAERVVEPGEFRLVLRVPPDWLKYIMVKGFIAVEGSSLTVARAGSQVESPAGEAWGIVEIHLIPETLRVTNLGQAELGSRLNVELDARTVAIVDTVERILAARDVTSGSSS